jgi:hypothetical protein
MRCEAVEATKQKEEKSKEKTDDDDNYNIVDCKYLVSPAHYCFLLLQ